MTESYKDEIEKIDNVGIVSIPGLYYLQASLRAVAAAVETSVVCGPPLKSWIREQWATPNVWGRQLM